MGRGRPHKCPYCGATTSVAKGFRYNKSGKVRLRRCKGCKRRWTTGPVPDEQEAGSGVDAAETPASQDPIAHEQTDADNHEQPAQNSDDMTKDETDSEEERRIELPLSPEVSPSQNDPGEEKNEESEKTFFAQ